MKYLLNDKAYKALKWAGLIACPALATFIGVVAPLWGMPHVDAVVTTINALGVLIGALIGASQLTATNEDEQIFNELISEHSND